MPPRFVSNRMMLSSGIRFIVLWSRRSPERTSVATRPATIPFMEFDIGGPPKSVDTAIWTQQRSRGNCVPLSQVLHVASEGHFATHAIHATLLARNYYPDGPQGRRRCHRRRRTGVDRPGYREGARQKGSPPGQG